MTEPDAPSTPSDDSLDADAAFLAACSRQRWIWRIGCFLPLCAALLALDESDMPYAGLLSVLAVIVYFIASSILPCYWNRAEPPSSCACGQEEPCAEDLFVEEPAPNPIRETNLILVTAIREGNLTITRDMLMASGSAFAALVRTRHPELTFPFEWERFLARLRHMTIPADLRDGEEISFRVWMRGATYRVRRRADGPVEIRAESTSAGASVSGMGEKGA